MQNLKGNIKQVVKVEYVSKFCSCQSWELSWDIANQKFLTTQWTSTKYWLDARYEKLWPCQNHLKNCSQNQNLKKLFLSNTLLEGSVKLTSMQLVGEFIAAISVPLDAIMKLENVNYWGKRLLESAVELVWKRNFFRLKKHYEV